MYQTGLRGLHPAAAFLFFAAALTVSMTATNPYVLLLSVAAAAALDLRLRGRRAARFLGGAVLPLTLLIAACNGIFSHYGVTPLFTLPGGNRFTLEALAFGLVFALRAAAALLWLQSFHEIVTAEKFIFLFGRASPRTALVLSMALRFLPLLSEQSAAVRIAARGAGNAPAGRGPLARLRASARRFSVLLSWVLEKGVDTADSMRARGYGLPGRRSAADYVFTPADLAAALLSVLGAAAYFALYSALRASYNPVISVPVPGAAQAAVLAVLAAALFFPLIFDITEKRKWKR